MTQHLDKTSRRGIIVVVTGTDTEIGKTFTTVALASRLRAEGVNLVAVKPVESGCTPDRAGEEDGELLAKATGQHTPTRALQRLLTPVAPPVAAALEGVVLEPDAWITRIKHLATQHDLVLVEGAGGLLSPIADDLDALSLAAALDAHSLLISADRLGTLNHTLLTLRVLAHEARPVVGVIMSTPSADRDDASLGRNLDTLRQLAPTLRTCGVPHVTSTDAATAHLDAPVQWLRDLMNP